MRRPSAIGLSLGARAYLSPVGINLRHHLTGLTASPYARDQVAMCGFQENGEPPLTRIRLAKLP